MNAQNPRDMREYLRILERQGAQLRGLPALIQQNIEEVKDEDEKDKDRRPAAPVELAPQTAIYIDTSNRRRVRFILDFPDVVYNTDGTAAVIQQYELWAREETPSVLEKTTSAVPSQAAPGATMPGLASTASNEGIAAEPKPWMIQSTNVQSFFRVDGYIAGSVWRFRARALGSSTVQPGEWSEELVVQMLADKLPPPQASAPTITSSRGQLTVSWDGLSVLGAMPADFKYAILAHGTASSPTFEIARFGRGGGFKVVTGLEYYDPQFFRIRAYDETGNAGPWSEQAFGYTTPLVDKDLIISTIDAAKTHLKNINAGVSILPNTIITEHLVVTEEMTAAIANFLVVNADQINVNSLAADEVFTGLLDAILVVSDMFEGKEFHGGVFTTTRGGRFQTDVEEYQGLKIDATGMLGYSPRGGVETFKYDAATGDISIAGGTYTGGKFQTHPDVTQGMKIDSAGMRGYSPLGAETFKYESKTGDVSIGGGTFTGGRFQTTAEINRGLKITSTVLVGYGPSGGETFKYDAKTGDVSIGDGVFTGGKYQTHLHSTRGIKISDAGMVGYSPKSVPTFEYDSATGDVSIGGGTFTGGKFQSSAFDDVGVKLDGNGLKVWNKNGQLSVDASPSGSTFTGRITSGFGASKAIMADGVFSGRPGISLVTGSNFDHAEPFLISYGATSPGDSTGTLYMSAAWRSSSSSPGRLLLHPGGEWSLGGSSSNAGNDDSITSNGSSIQIVTASGGQLQVGREATWFRAANTGSYVEANISGETTVAGGGSYLRLNQSGASVVGNFSVNGSKNFVMEHPTKPGLELLHGSTESPVSGIEYWGEGTVGPGGEGVVELPEYFEALAKPEGRVVLVVGRGEVLDWSDVVDGKVTVYGNPGARYSWLVKAERFGGDFDVEREAPEALDTSALMDAVPMNNPQPL